MDISYHTSADALFIQVCSDGDNGSCLHPCLLSDGQLVTFTSSALPRLVCSQRAPNYVLVSSSSLVTGKESGIGMAGTCRHTAPCWWGAPPATPHAMGKGIAWFHLVRKAKFASPRQGAQCSPSPVLQPVQEVKSPQPGSICVSGGGCSGTSCASGSVTEPECPKGPPTPEPTS